ncbi:MAG TPA: ankyrin repeat domain-containing protein [Pyrinomonadaceae bacterium]|jgi:hypothetical protein|nr:ankyrin repeat domain-containing protein [Pyrinomonadaceae bacterium]
MSSLSLIAAVKNGNYSEAEELLRSGADVNQQDEQGWTAVNFAAGRGDVAFIDLLAARGADPVRVGRDRRTPYMIALAAGHASAARRLKELEEKAAAGDGRGPERKYCRLYPLSELRRFAGWAGEGGADAAAYLHQDYSVTGSIWPGEKVIFRGESEGWKEFCDGALNFRVPDDLELIG